MGYVFGNKASNVSLNDWTGVNASILSTANGVTNAQSLANQLGISM